MRLIVIAVLVCFIAGFECRELKEAFTWSRISYAGLGSTESRNGYQQEGASSSSTFLFPESGNDQNNFGGSYIYENNIPMGANRWKDKLFVTVPRRRVGVPSTLNFVWMNSTERHNVPLIPYPNWRINQFDPTREPDNFVSIYRTAVDACDRLWMVDTGLIETPGNNTRVLPARIIIIDLNTDKVIRQYTLKPSDVVPHSTLANLAVDVTANTCDRAFLYIPDLSGYGLVVYDFHENDSWRVRHNFFFVESLHGDFNVGGQRFHWNDGVFSVALSGVNPDGFRTMYFHSMAGVHIFSVSTRVVRDRGLATRSNHESDFKIAAERAGGSQTSASDLHQPSGVLFLSLVNQNAIGCWNVNNNARSENFDIIHKDDQKLIYPCDLKVYQDEVIVLSNTMPVFLFARLNYDETNFRVWISKVSDAVRDTSCAAMHRKPAGRY
ncbi:hypothetical protein ILUMI_26653 [Ignelater luminosus]|uniref:Uncharacterized protein n=1 Tax=Ignelater luminosus TaxID=2038154 RepID=A0A8K0C6A4_IGNLU|nr:hypothetical protein ILUMI_26653 [Ignelater luminosus]